MFATAVAVMCQLVVAEATLAPDTECTSEEMRFEAVVTDSDLDPRFDFMGCMVGSQINVADWKQHNPRFLKSSWRVARIKCVQGHYTVKNDI